MEDLVVHYGIDLEGGEPGVGCRSYKEEEGSCVMSVQTAEGTRLQGVSNRRRVTLSAF